MGKYLFLVPQDISCPNFLYSFFSIASNSGHLSFYRNSLPANSILKVTRQRILIFPLNSYSSYLTNFGNWIQRVNFQSQLSSCNKEYCSMLLGSIPFRKILPILIHFPISAKKFDPRGCKKSPEPKSRRT